MTPYEEKLCAHSGSTEQIQKTGILFGNTGSTWTTAARGWILRQLSCSSFWLAPSIQGSRRVLQGDYDLQAVDAW